MIKIQIRLFEMLRFSSSMLFLVLSYFVFLFLCDFIAGIVVFFKDFIILFFNNIFIGNLYSMLFEMLNKFFHSFIINSMIIKCLREQFHA